MNKCKSVKELYLNLKNNKVLNYTISGENTNLFAIDECTAVEFKILELEVEINGFFYFKIDLSRTKVKLDFYCVTHYGVLLPNCHCSSAYAAVTKKLEKIRSK